MDRQLYSLQIGRALAALAVMLHHAVAASQAFAHAIPPMFAAFAHMGYLGVDYFFVLSGFIIAHSTRTLPQNATGAKKYAISRAARIYIPYIPISLAMMAALQFIPALSQGARMHFSIPASFLLVPANAPTALAVVWTLQYEMVFYLLFGLCFFGLKNQKLLFLWALPIVILALMDIALPRWMMFLFGILNLEFLFGIIACNLFHHGKLYNARYLLVVFGLAVVVAAGYIVSQHETIFYYRPLTGFGFACMVLGLVHCERHAHFGKRKLWLLLGAASYAIYLVHGPLISVLVRFVPAAPYWFAVGVFVFCSCACGVLYHLLFEKPLLARAKKYFMHL